MASCTNANYKKKIIIIIYNNQRNRNGIGMRKSKKNDPKRSDMAQILVYFCVTLAPYGFCIPRTLLLSHSLSLLWFKSLSVAQFRTSFAFNMDANILNYTLLMVINYGYASLHFGIMSFRFNIFPHFSRLICNTVCEYACVYCVMESAIFSEKTREKMK